MKFNKGFFGRLLLSYLVIIFISLTIIGIMFGYLIQNYYFGLKEWEATNNGRRIAELVSENISGGTIRSNRISQAKDKIQTIARSSNMGIGLMNSEGRIILNIPTIENFNLTLEEIEIEHVLKGNTITKKIMGPEYKNLLMVIPLKETKDTGVDIMEAQSLDNQHQLVGAVVIQTPLGSVTATINNIIRLILYSFLMAIIAAVILSISFSRRVTKPLADIQRSALQSAEGKFHNVQVPENSSKEIKHLVNTFNYAVTQIRETLQKKKNLEKMRKEFVVNVSHEFRAPLTSIKGFLEIMQEQNLSPDEIKECVNIMYEDAEYLEHLLSDLLVLGQLESENTILHKEYIYPEKLIKRTLKTMKNKFGDKEIHINLELDDNLPEIYVDINRINQVLLNLLENAVNYSPVGGEITISTHLLQENRVEFSISDQGPGIPEDEISNIWQRFYKVDRARTRERKKGSGLGLAIVKEIIEKHGGIIDVKSKPGSGSTFSFII